MADKTTAGTAQPSHSSGQPKPFPPLDPATFAPQLIWLALTFGLLYVLLKRYVLTRVRTAIEDRRGSIQRDLERAEALKSETERALADYEQALAAARTRANALAKTVHDDLAAATNEQLARGEAEIAKKVADAELRIMQAKSKAQASVTSIAEEIAGAIVARLIGGQVSKDEVRKALVRRAAE
jgi:F-type H+-transporting ATPase subunit b